MSTVGETVWTPSAPDLPSPKLQFRSTDNCIFKVHDSLLFPQSLALQILLGDMPADDAASTILPINISSDGLKLILHFVYNAEPPTGGWFYAGHKSSGVSLQTVQAAVLGCQQYMMHTIASALEGPLRANMKTDPLLAAVIAHIPVISNMTLREDTIRLAAGNAGSFLGSQSPRRALLPATAVDLLYQHREDLQAVIKRQETSQSAKIVASFKIDDLSRNEYENFDDENHLPHFQTCRHWPMVGNVMKLRLNELLLDLLREKVGLKKCMEVDVDIGCSIRTNCRGCRDLVTQNLQRLVTELSNGVQVMVGG